MRKVSRLDLPKRVEIFEFMKDKIEAIEPASDGTKRCLYKDTWNDAKIAEHFGVTIANAAGVRLEMFGNIAAKPKAVFDASPDVAELKRLVERNLSALEIMTRTISDMSTTIAELHKEVAQVSALEGRIAYLERALGITPDDLFGSAA